MVRENTEASQRNGDCASAPNSLDEEVRRTSCWMSWEGILACAESMGGRFVTVGFAIPTEEMASFPHEVDGNHRNAGLVPG